MAKKKQTVKADHECYELVNEKLKPMGAVLDTSLQMDFGSGTASLVLKLPLRRYGDSKKRLPTMVVAYCPICGKKVE